MKSALRLFALCYLIVTPASAGIIYTNGPVNGTAGSFGISGGSSVSDSFTLTSAATINTFDFASWNAPGATVTQVDWLIGTTAFAGDGGFGTATVTSSFLFTNGVPMSIYMNTVSGLNLSLGVGTYWLTLENALANPPSPVGWDINNGPSSALNPVPSQSETFDILSPEPGSVGLLAGGLLAMAGILRRRKSR